MTLIQGQGQVKTFKHNTFTSNDYLKKVHCNDAYFAQKLDFLIFEMFDLDIEVTNSKIQLPD